jgi:hypothetical protein
VQYSAQQTIAVADVRGAKASALLLIALSARLREEGLLGIPFKDMLESCRTAAGVQG